jgi:cytochrome d ubiquinol oxidase subunit I
MQTPAGSHIVQTPLGPRAEITSFWEMVFNPSSMDRLCHVLLGCWLTGAFFVISVAAYYLLKQRHIQIAKSMMTIGLSFAMLSLVLQLISGDSSAKVVARHQPAKLAALEGVYKTAPNTPISVFGWVDAKNETVHSLKIPGALSFLTYGNAAKPVPGLDQVPRDEWPNVALTFQTYHIMVAMWSFMFLIALLGIYYGFKKTLEKRRWLLWTMVFSVLLPHIAQQCGWACAEVGRQPWIVYKLLRTSEGVSTSIVAGQVIGSITMFVVIYCLLFALFIFLLDRKIKHGPDEAFPEYDDQLYRDITKTMPS